MGLKTKLIDFLEEPKNLETIYSNFPDEKPTTIRGRLNENINKCFKRIEKGVYLSIKGKAQAIIIEGDAWANVKDVCDKSIDSVITDSPYTCLNQHYHGTTRERNREGNIGFPTKDMDLELMKGLYRVLKDGGHFFSFMPAYSEATLENNNTMIKTALEAGFTFKKIWVWDRKHISLGYNGRNRHELIAFFSKGKRRMPHDMSIPDVLAYARIASTKRIHDAEKPVELIKDIMKFSNLAGDVVLDPFAGSLSTAQAGLELGINTISFEIDKAMIEKAIKLRNMEVV